MSSETRTATDRRKSGRPNVLFSLRTEVVDALATMADGEGRTKATMVTRAICELAKRLGYPAPDWEEMQAGWGGTREKKPAQKKR